MGNHFVPQAYLRAFQDPQDPGMIWTDPRRQPARLAAIDKVAQSSGFYDAETERDLNVLIEAPANPVLELLRTDRSTDAAGRHRVAVYVATMAKRVPRSRQRGVALLPVLIESTVAKLQSEFHEAAARGVIDPQRLDFLLAQTERVHGEFHKSAPAEVLAYINQPWPSPAIVDAVQRLHWRVFVADSPEMFLTSDNPAFFFEEYGLATDRSELCLPLSPRRCLYCCSGRMPGEDLSLLTLRSDWIREVNRRVASGATSVVFAHQRRKWPTTLLLKSKPHLSRFVWTGV
jgi:Protein of unknown function (DUF4238)